MDNLLIVLLLFIGIVGGLGVGYLLFKEKNREIEREHIKKQYLDSLTDLPNRNKFLEDIEEAKGIILMDLDDFSIFNDVYSKEVGDEILVKLSRKLNDSNCMDNFYRLGSDEFAIISKEEKDLKEIAECLLDIIHNFYMKKDNIVIQVGATFSISYTEPLLETADLSLKYAKKHKSNLQIYSKNLGVYEENEAFLDVTMRIKKALKENNIVPFFQCVKDNNGETVKYEALMRLKEGEKYIVPAVFMDIAKQTKLYPELTLQMVKKTFEYMRDKDIPFSINLSYDDILNHRIYKFILREIELFPKKSNIIIELLETEAIEQFNYVRSFITDIHNRGAKIAIDDFGSGYSNFIYLEKLKPDIIKIDGTIVQKVLSSDNAEFLVRTIVDFCKKNNLVSVAEYVSNRDIFKELQELGVDEYQGFYFCEPKEEI